MPSIEEEVGQLLRDKGLTIAVAEACTGGLVGSMLISVPGSSRYFVGGVIAYTGGSKTEVLGVTRELAGARGYGQCRCGSGDGPAGLAAHGHQCGSLHHGRRRPFGRALRPGGGALLHRRWQQAMATRRPESCVGTATGTGTGRTRPRATLELVREYLLQKS